MKDSPNLNIHPLALVEDNVSIAASAYIGAFSVIGARPEHRSHHNNEDLVHGVVVKSRVVVREGVLIQQGTFVSTVVEEDAFIMGNTTIGHDSFIGYSSTIGPGCHIAGNSHLSPQVTLGMGTAIHQGSRLGRLVMTSMNSVVKGPVAPFLLLVGPSGMVAGANTVGIQRLGLGEGWIDDYLENLDDVFNGLVPASLPEEVKNIIREWQTLL